MKTLTNYTEQKTTDLFNNLGAFFAFSDRQYKENKKDGVKYCSLGGGLIAPTEHAKELAEGLLAIGQAGREQDLAENGKEGIIRRELFNYECFYIGEIDDCVEALKQYGITKKEVLLAFNHILKTEDIDF